MKLHISILTILTLLLPTLLAETLHTLKVRDLNFTDKQTAAEAINQRIWPTWRSWHDTQKANLRLPTEAYIAALRTDNNNNRVNQGDLEIVFKASNKTPISGFIDLKIDSEIKSFPITLDPQKIKTTTPENFKKIKQAHYRNLSKNHLPGTPYFKHLSGPIPENNRNRWNSAILSETFGIFSGGRAISENLALDRNLLLATSKDNKTIPISEIKGVTVAPIDWTGKLPKKEIAIDPLSLHIPVDQHALFAPSLDSLFNLIDIIEKEGAPLLQTFTVRNPFRTLPSKYRTQMGLDLPNFTAKLLPIKSVAVTGGDPFFPMGTDVAILFETEKPEALYKTLQTAIQLKAKSASATQQPITIDGATTTGFTNPTRSFSSYLIRHGNLVAIANSPSQLTRLAAVQNKKQHSLGSTDEFKYFRHRYPLSNSIFVFLSDETIRRWSGPELRIGASRRTRAAAALGQLTSQQINNEKLTTDLSPLLGKTTSNKNQIQSQKFNTLDFITPVSELKIKTASSSEANAYNQWRRGYESGWATVFDPIAIQLDLTKDTHEIDLTVLPLTVNSTLNEFIDLIGTSKLSPLSRATPEGTVLLASLAIDHDALLKKYRNLLGYIIPDIEINPLAWIGQSASIYINDGFIWKALQETEPNADMMSQLPILLRVESTSQVKLALALTALKGIVDTSAPGLINWEQNKHKNTPYVTLTGDKQKLGPDISIHYAALPTAFLITLDEDMLKQAIDRENTPLTEAQKQKIPTAQHLFFDTSPAFLAGTNKIFNNHSLTKQTQLESYKALPILNEWHRLYPDRDPVQVHHELFAADIHCPGGKGYQWNPKAHTMESIAYGHPANPKQEANPIPLITKFKNLRTSMTFQDGGVRIKAKLGPTQKPVLKTTQNQNPILTTPKEIVISALGSESTFARITNGKKTTPIHHKITRSETKNGITRYDDESTQTSENGEVETTTTHLELGKNLSCLGQSSDAFDRTYGNPVITIPHDLRAGSVTTSEYESEYLYDGKIIQESGQVRHEVIGLETITVPAGKFQDCIHIKSTYSSIVNGNFNKTISHAWFKPGYHAIRYHGTSQHFDMILELISRKPSDQKK